MLTQKGTKEIETRRLQLRRFQQKDGDDVLQNWSSDEAMQALYGEPAYNTKEAVEELLAQYIAGYKKKEYYRWAIVEKKSQTCIGQIAFYMVDSKNHLAEIEYCIGRTFQGKGYATEATKAIIEFGFEQIGFYRIQICHKSQNIPSKRVIEKCGFRYEGTFRDYFYMEGIYTNRVYYALLKEDR